MRLEQNVQNVKLRKLGIVIFLFALLLCLFSSTAQAKELADSSRNSELSISNLPQVHITTVSGSAVTITKDYGEATINIKDISTNNNLSASGKIKVRGNSTAAAPKKPYKIKFSKKQDVLGMGKYKNRVLLANAFDKTLIRNKLVFDFANEMNLAYTPQSRFVDVWVDGKICWELSAHGAYRSQ